MCRAVSAPEHEPGQPAATSASAPLCDLRMKKLGSILLNSEPPRPAVIETQAFGGLACRSVSPLTVYGAVKHSVQHSQF